MWFLYCIFIVLNRYISSLYLLSVCLPRSYFNKWWRTQQCLQAPQNWEEALHRNLRRCVCACGILHKLDRGVQICEFGETRERTTWSVEINNQKSYTRALVASSHSISCVFLDRVRASTLSSRKEKLGIYGKKWVISLSNALDPLILIHLTMSRRLKGDTTLHHVALMTLT